jgi:hypothetical protein
LRTELNRLKQAPFLDILICALIIVSNLALASNMTIVSDALFIEGMPLSVIGAILALERGIVRSPIHLSKKVPGLRIFFVGTVLLLASVMVAELLH